MSSYRSRPVSARFLGTVHTSVGTYRRRTEYKRSLFSLLCTSWMLLWRLIIILVFTYQGRVRRYCSEPPLAFPWTEVSKAAQKANEGSGRYVYVYTCTAQSFCACAPRVNNRIILAALYHVMLYAK